MRTVRNRIDDTQWSQMAERDRDGGGMVEYV